MAQARRRGQLSFSDHVERALREGAMWSLMCAALYLLLALASYHPDDPGWSHVGDVERVRNAAGPAGAWFADATFYLLGFFAYLIPVLVGWSAWLIFRGREHASEPRPWVLSLRWLGFLLTLLAGSALASIHLGALGAGLENGTGGALGRSLSGMMLDAFNVPGSDLLLGGALLVGMTLFWGISWLKLLDRTGASVLQAWRSVREALEEARSWFRRGRDLPALSPEGLPAALNLLDPHEADSLIPPRRARSVREVLPAAVRDALHEEAPASPSQAPEPMLDRIEALPDFLRVGAATTPVSGQQTEPDLSAPEPHPAEPEPNSKPESLQALEVSRELEALGLEPVRAHPDAGESAEAPVAAPLPEAFDIETLSEPDEHSAMPPPASFTGSRLERLNDEALDDEQHVEEDEAPLPDPPRLSLQPEPAPESEPPVTATLPPPLELLDAPRKSGRGYTEAQLDELSNQVELRLADFGVDATVEAVYPGPVVTLFEIDLAPGTKVSKITGLAKDLARALSTISVRVVEVIPGKSLIGLEIPNEQREIVFLREIFGAENWQQSKSPLTLGLGTNIAGQPVVADLARMPHALIAGTTGSGKSVAINAMILSLLYKASPRDVRLIMVDPKMLELSVYEGIPHLLTPVVTDMKEAANALRWCVGEMERRYRLMAKLGVRNIAGYNRQVAEAEAAGTPIPDPTWDPALGEAPPLDHLPYIVVIIDELADMMMVVGKKVEELIARLAQKARASGIHLLLATQRPSVDVLTGLIKANIPTRMAFQVSSRIDSRTILDQMGAEQLLGHGDMLYLPPGSNIPERVHGAFVDDHEVHHVVDYLKRCGTPDYIEDVLREPTETLPGIDPEPRGGGDTEDTDPLFDEAVQIVLETRRASISGVQRRLKIGYNRAARMIEEMERIGIVSPAETNGNREVLVPSREEE
ncbi:MAG: DNA translocase FtsK 4TM domain-containing protein [Chromatiaceae bacterium]|nr:DNA translocase FtsK 4TM domain-containing protein [Chromatiaceae bacterium]